MKIGFFGGSFDPPHLGHLHVANAALEHLALDVVLFVPTYLSPFKKARGHHASAEHRLRMTQLLIQGNPKMAMSDIEALSHEVCFTSDTLNDLKRVMPGDYWILMGDDQLHRFMEWKNAATMLRAHRIGLVARKTIDIDELMEDQAELLTYQTDYIPVAPLPIASTEIRARLEKGRPCDEFLTPEVSQYINENGLYARKPDHIRT